MVGLIEIKTLTFAEFVHQRRRDLNITLREFCQKHEFDAGLISKIEQGIYPARALGDDLVRYGTALKIRHFSALWEKFIFLATISEPLYPNGPSDEELLDWLPVIVKPGLTTDKLRENIREELTYAGP